MILPVSSNMLQLPWNIWKNLMYGVEWGTSHFIVSHELKWFWIALFSKLQRKQLVSGYICTKYYYHICTINKLLNSVGKREKIAYTCFAIIFAGMQRSEQSTVLIYVALLNSKKIGCITFREWSSRSWIVSIFAKETIELKFATALHLSLVFTYPENSLHNLIPPSLFHQLFVIRRKLWPGSFLFSCSSLYK